MGYETPGFKDRWEQLRTCPCCGKTYKQICSEQAAGFREKDFDVCPYCNFTVRSSTKFEFNNYELEKE